MTLLEVAKHALEAMEDAMYRADTHEFYDAKESLRYAIEQAEQVKQVKQEPVAVVRWNDIGHISWRTLVMLPDGTPLYTSAPTPRKPLTDEEVLRVLMLSPPEPSLWPHLKGEAVVGDVQRAVIAISRAIEAAHGIVEQV